MVRPAFYPYLSAGDLVIREWFCIGDLDLGDILCEQLVRAALKMHDVRRQHGGVRPGDAVVQDVVLTRPLFHFNYILFPLPRQLY